VDEPSTFGIHLAFLFTRKKVYASKHFGIKASSSMGPHLSLSIFGKEEVV
jgi:hypothetical protein